MLKDKKVLCLGNNTRETDQLTTKLAQNYECINHGLIEDCDFSPEKTGFYHSSLHDLDKENMLELASRFDHVILWNQPKESYDNITVYYETKHILNLISMRFKIITEILDA